MEFRGIPVSVKEDTCDLICKVASLAGVEITAADISTSHRIKPKTDLSKFPPPIVYRHPNTSLQSFLDHFSKILEQVHKESKLCVIMGDFNINLLNCDSHTLTGESINLLSSYFFQPHILQPTRITSHSATLIDNIFFNSLEFATYSGNILYSLTDHLPNLLSIDSIHPLPLNKQSFVRDFSRFNKESLLSDFQRIDWHNLFFGKDNINAIFSCFLNKSNQIINSHVPIKMLSRKEVKSKTKPWISLGLRASINIKNKIYRKFIRTRNQFLYLKFKLYRNKLNHLITLSKRKYYEGCFRCNKSNIKNIWKGIKQLVALKPQAYTTPTKIVTSSNTVLTKASDIANAFNHYFVKVGKSLSQAIPRVDALLSSFLFNPLPHSFFPSPTSVQEIQDIILSLKSGKASGPFRIPVSLLKILSSIIAKPFQII